MWEGRCDGRDYLRSWSELEARVSPSQLVSLELRLPLDGLRLLDEYVDPDPDANVHSSESECAGWKSS